MMHSNIITANYLVSFKTYRYLLDFIYGGYSWNQGVKLELKLLAVVEKQFIWKWLGIVDLDDTKSYIGMIFKLWTNFLYSTLNCELDMHDGTMGWWSDDAQSLSSLTSNVSIDKECRPKPQAYAEAPLILLPSDPCVKQT